VTAETVIAAGRRFQEARMPATCTITRVTGRTFNEATGEYTDTVQTVYTGKCRLDFRASLQTLERDMEGQLLADQRPTLFLPIVGSEAVTVNDMVTVTGNPLDGAAVGMRIRVTGLSATTYATARRLPGEVLT
jgi:hypothetical protein